MLQQSQIINVRVNPQVYQLFKKKIMARGLNPSTYLRHVVISLALSDDDLGRFISTLPQNKISEPAAMRLVANEKRAHYGKG